MPARNAKAYGLKCSRRRRGNGARKNTPLSRGPANILAGQNHAASGAHFGGKAVMKAAVIIAAVYSCTHLIGLFRVERRSSDFEASCEPAERREAAWYPGLRNTPLSGPS